MKLDGRRKGALLSLKLRFDSDIGSWYVGWARPRNLEIYFRGLLELIEMEDSGFLLIPG